MPDSHSSITSISIAPEQAISLQGLFYERVRQSPDKTAYVQYDKQQNCWQSWCWQEMADRISSYQAALAQEALQKGDKVGICLKNSTEWVCFDQAALGLGLVVVPLYLDDRPDNMHFILQDAEVKVLIMQDARQWKRLKQALETHQDHLPELQTIIIRENYDKIKTDDARLVSLKHWLANQTPLSWQKYQCDPHALATIVYTSGTTGRPKGVMLSHYNILSVAYSTINKIDIMDSDSLLSFLPLSHTLERTVGYYLPVMCGCKVSFSQSIQKLAAELVLHQPTVLVAVPRIFEQIYCKIHDQLDRGAHWKRWLFKRTLAIGWQQFLADQKHDKYARKNCWYCTLLWPVLKKMVADKLLQKFGGKLRLAASGGAPISFPVAQTFLSMGLNLIQGYGLTETSPVVSFNRFDNNDPASIGEAIDVVEVKLGENDELLIKSPGVMLGYWHNSQATQAVIDTQGWFHSGDQARIDTDTGHIYITGRIKDILVMSNGEKIPPGDIENTLSMDSWFEQALLLGEGQAWLSAILVINPDQWKQLAQQYDLDADNPDSLQHKKIHQAVLQHLKTVLADFPGYAKIRRVILTLEPWTIDNKMMTPTMKLKRAQIKHYFQQQIDDIYC